MPGTTFGRTPSSAGEGEIVSPSLDGRGLRGKRHGPRFLILWE